MTWRVAITRDETRRSGGASAEITAYIELDPEPNDGGFGRLERVRFGVWNSRLLIAGDFATLEAALAAIDAQFPELTEIACLEWPVDYENPLDMAPLVKSGGRWAPDPRRAPPGPPPQLDWRDRR